MLYYLGLLLEANYTPFNVLTYNTVRAGGQSSLINQLMGADSRRGANETGSDLMRRVFASELSRGSVAQVAKSLAVLSTAGVMNGVSSIGPSSRWVRSGRRAAPAWRIGVHNGNILHFAANVWNAGPSTLVVDGFRRLPPEALGFTLRQNYRRYNPMVRYAPRPRAHPWILQWATMIDATVLGIGDRGGCVALEEIAPLLAMYGYETNVDLGKLHALCGLAQRLFRVPLAPWKPVAGESWNKEEGLGHLDGAHDALASCGIAPEVVGRGFGA